MIKQTEFHYKGDPYILNDCYVFPFNKGLVANAINSEFQDGYVTSRKRVSRIFSVYTLNFEGIKEVDKLIAQRLENVVGQADIFTWYPSHPLDPLDYTTDDEGNEVLDIQPREVRFISPMQFEYFAPGLYNFTMNLQEAI